MKSMWNLQNEGLLQNGETFTRRDVRNGADEDRINGDKERMVISIMNSTTVTFGAESIRQLNMRRNGQSHEC